MRHARKRSANAVLALLGALLLASGGCDTFTPRVAPPPCDPATDPDCRPPAREVDPTSPRAVVDNIIAALNGYTVEPNYRNALSALARDNGEPAFEYIPEPGLADLHPGVFDGWEENREVRFMLDLLESGSARPINVDFKVTQFEETDFPVPTTNEKRYNVEYDLTLTFRDSTQDPPVDRTERYCATALWDFFGGDRNAWVLERWEEISPSTDDTCRGSMGLLRATTG